MNQSTKAEFEEFSLFDHFLTVGIDSGSREYTFKAVQNNEFTVDVMDIYPLEGTGIPKYLEHIKMWSFPDGYCVYDSSLSLVNCPGNDFFSANSHPEKLKTPSREKAWRWIQENKNTIHHFVMTDQNGLKRYCTTIMFHERMFVKREADHDFNETLEEIYAPKSISLISRLPYFELQKQILRYLFYNVILTKGETKRDKLLRISKKLLDEFKSNKKYFGNERAEIMWDKMMADQKRELCVETIKEAEFLSKRSADYIYFRESSLIEFYISTIFSVLPLSEDQNEFSILRPFSTNPDPASKRSEEEMWRYRCSNNGPLNLMNISYQPIFDKLSIENIFLIYKSILLERQVLFFSSDSRDIVYVCEALLSFIQPLKWNLLYIPFLPIKLWQTLHVMIPFIIGISSKYRKSIESNFDLSEKVIVDLDTGNVSAPEEDEKFNIPNVFRSPLLNQLKAIKGKFEESQSKKSFEKTKKKDWNECVLNFRHAFYSFLLRLINNYTPYFLYSIHNDENTLRSNEIFDHNSYLKSFPRDAVEFIKEFTQKTMMFATLLEESYKILYQSEHLKNKDYLNECQIEAASFIRSLQNIERVTKSSTRKSTYITSEEFDFYENKIQVDQLSKEIQIKGIIESTSNPITKDLIPYLAKYLVHLEQVEFNIDISSLLAPLRNPKKEYKFLFFKDSSSKKKPQANQSLKEINGLNQMLPKLSKKRLVNLHRMYGGVSVQNPTKIKIKLLNIGAPVEKEDELVEASSKNKPKILEKATSFNESGVSIIEDESNKESFLNILNHKVWHECKYMKSNKKSRKDLAVYKSLQNEQKAGAGLFKKSKGSKKNLNLPILLDALQKKHQIQKKPEPESSRISKNPTASDLNQSLNSTGIMQSSIPDEKVSVVNSKNSNKENRRNESNNVAHNIEKKLSKAYNSNNLSSNEKAIARPLEAFRPESFRKCDKKVENESKQKIFFTGQHRPLSQRGTVFDSREPEIKTIKMDLDSVFEKSICDTSRNKIDLANSEHEPAVPVLKVNKLKSASIITDEPNSSFQVFSYLISDIINQNSSIQYPSRKSYNKPNTMREKCLTVGDEVYYANETICFLNDDDAADLLGTRTAEPSMYPVKSAREQNDRLHTETFEYEENRFYTVGDEPDDSFNDGDCDINCSEKKIKNFEMVKRSISVENKILARNSVSTKKINLFSQDAFKKGNTITRKAGRKKIFCDEKEDRNYRNGSIPNSFCHTLPNESASVRGTKSFIESPSELKLGMEGIMKTCSNQLRKKKNTSGYQNCTKIIKVPIFNINENKKSYDFKNNSSFLNPLNNVTVR